MMIYILTSGSIGAWKCWLAGWSVILKRQGRTFSEDYDRPTNPPTIGHEDPNNSLRVTLSTRAPSDNHFNLSTAICFQIIYILCQDSQRLPARKKR